MQAGLYYLCLRGAKKLGSGLPFPVRGRQSCRYFDGTLAHGSRTCFLGNHHCVKKTLAGLIECAPADRNHCQVEFGNGHEFLIPDIPRKSKNLFIEGLGRVQFAYDTMKLSKPIGRSGDFMLIGLLSGPRKRFHNISTSLRDIAAPQRRQTK